MGMINKTLAAKAVSRYLWSNVMTSSSERSCEETADEILNLPEVKNWINAKEEELSQLHKELKELVSQWTVPIDTTIVAVKAGDLIFQRCAKELSRILDGEF